MKRVLSLWNHIGIWTSGIAMFLMMSLTATDVCGRYVFRNAIDGASELTELMMVIIIFLSLSDTSSSGGHIAVEVITSRLSPIKQQILKAVTSLLSGVAIGIVAWRTGVNALYTFKHPETMPVLDIPKAPFMALSAIGCAMASIALIAIFWDGLSQSIKKPGDK
jgi:TRAP-type C4-dicarboxylate transport system permease small subunit